ncbi:hypothetical protein EJ05DRAFT_482756 [Pseudovirgaria hyperparasitica]|uniref:Uncharacterized protein n=1 Tax=Pseudovirgaria hyperparasitica TaxID=470096 RepID=A0A6A6WI83_9PEZI|nr:uncharacterized protein EJ05DRAFT_482756 [Pseudovirgaria hyperparasitica]KAF2761949.1 hypothetical protein EJ05DRAFT_482756 [Pseudovirgaria hyperparasitica]
MTGCLTGFQIGRVWDEACDRGFGDCPADRRSCRDGEGSNGADGCDAGGIAIVVADEGDRTETGVTGCGAGGCAVQALRCQGVKSRKQSETTLCAKCVCVLLLLLTPAPPPSSTPICTLHEQLQHEYVPSNVVIAATFECCCMKEFTSWRIVYRTIILYLCISRLLPTQ